MGLCPLELHVGDGDEGGPAMSCSIDKSILTSRPQDHSDLPLLLINGDLLLDCLFIGLHTCNKTLNGIHERQGWEGCVVIPTDRHQNWGEIQDQIHAKVWKERYPSVAEIGASSWSLTSEDQSMSTGTAPPSRGFSNHLLCCVSLFIVEAFYLLGAA